MSKPLVLLALHRFEGGGAERQAAYLANGLISRGYNVYVLGFGSFQGSAIAWFHELGLEVYSTGFSDRLLLDRTFNVKSIWLRLKYQTILVKKIRKLKVDFIIPFTYQPNVIYGSLWRRMRVKKYFWNQRDEGRFFLGRSWERRILENCSAIVSNSSEGKLFLEHFTHRKIEVIYNGVKSVQTSPIINKSGKKKVVMVANLHRFKDHMTLLKAWTILKADSFVEQWELLLAGKPGDAQSELVNYASTNFISTSVHFLGQTKDVTGLLDNCDLGVLCSHNEGLPNAILEYMAAGLPVVATRTSGVMDALGDDYEYLCKAGDEVDLAFKLKQLMTDDALRKKCGGRNKMRINENFGMDKMVNSFAQLLTV